MHDIDLTFQCDQWQGFQIKDHSRRLIPVSHSTGASILVSECLWYSLFSK